MKKTTIILIIAVNAILIGGIIALYFTVWKSDQKYEEGYLTITGVEEDIKLSIDDLQTLPNISQEYTLVGGLDGTVIANYTGVSVYYLLTEIVNISSEFDVIVIPIDNYVMPPFSFNEFNETRNIIIAYMKNGQFLKNSRHGGNGPLRLIFPQSYAAFNAQYCVKYVVALEISQVT
ncbi:MAG: molybdopterin-dependent oxidoreductase [Asgard group archaeon]|nr:molybdopterin-dependent oxidoreductase [Asgard group archaeon]